MLLAFQSYRAQTPDYDLAGLCLSRSLSLTHEEEFENFQGSVTKNKKKYFNSFLKIG